MKFLFGTKHHRVGSTQRIEGFSDAFIAIIITLLVLELHIPELADVSFKTFIYGFAEVFPHLLTFAFSFVTVAVFWVNHHHFFHEIDHADAHLLWYNNMLLFWLALTPFTTTFLGANPTNPGVGMLYCAVYFIAALSFMLMSRHAMYVGNLLDSHISDAMKAQHYRRGWIGAYCYFAATIAAPFMYWLSIIFIIFVPIFYVTPRLMHDHESMK